MTFFVLIRTFLNGEDRRRKSEEEDDTCTFMLPTGETGPEFIKNDFYTPESKKQILKLDDFLRNN